MNSKKSKNLSETKFTLYNFAGEAKDYYLVERKQLEITPENLGKPNIAHSIIIIDCSGSMTWDIQELKETLIKLLTLDEYSNTELLVTLISYASQGDVNCHFQRIPITKIMEKDSSYLKEIKAIKTRGLTCISQSLETAKTLIEEFVNPGEDGELTAITLHSDGYANDPSYNGESRNLEKLNQQLSKFNVFVNTISYSCADFKLLSKISNNLSGSCLQTNNIKEIYDSISHTSELLIGSVTPPIEEPLIKGYDYQVFVSKTANKINGSSGNLRIVGLKMEDEGTFYKYKKVSKEEYEQLTDTPIKQQDESVFALIKANLAEGNINTAKYGLASTFDRTLIQQHAKALTNQEISDFTKQIEQVIFDPLSLESHEILEGVEVSNKPTVIEILNLLETYKDNIIINLKHLQDNYQRRGLKRMKGSRDKEGNLIKPTLKTEAIDGGEYVNMGTFEINRNTANINILIARKVKLLRIEDEKQITEVAGILVNDLQDYNNYTLVGDGEINVKSLRVKINNKQVFEELKAKGVLEKESQPVHEYDFRCEYDIRLDNLPLVDFTGSCSSLEGVFGDLLEARILSSIFSAHLKEESDVYTSEQLEELKQHYLSKNLFLNFPTTTEYTDLKEALTEGTVDSRVSYKIDIGTREILNFSKLHSANKFLERLYEAYDQETGDKINKPTFSITLEQPLVFGHKTLSSRTKLTKVDEVMCPLFDNFLGLEDNGKITAILEKIGANKLLTILPSKWHSEAVNHENYIDALVDAKQKLDNYIEKIYRENVSPLVFYIGATGLLPDEINAKALTSDELNSKYPDLTISKTEQDGMFFEVGNTIISVYPKNEYFSIH